MRNGWKRDYYERFYSTMPLSEQAELEMYDYNNTYRNVIFSLDFAKAFWKDAEWEFQHYLQQMVLEKEPLKYLEQFL